MNYRCFLTILAYASAVAFAMPPHPELVNRVDQGVVALPYALANEDGLDARGIDSPTRIPYLDRLMERRHLDEDFNALAILIDFSDNTSQVAPSSYDQLLFGNSQGTLPHYISQVTYGALTVVTVNLPSALGWRRAPQTYAYYVNGQNGFGAYPHNAQKLTEDAIALVNPVVNFANYDNDGDSYVDALFIVHAGSGAEFTGNNNHIWSHKWQTSSPRAVDGVFAYVYSMEPELWSTPGDMTCGVYAHELGHAAFGLPDLYDTGNDSHGLGRWSLMAGGSWNGTLGNSPAYPDAWCRIRMGVVTPTVITGSQLGATIPRAEDNAVVFKLVPTGGNGNQYALVENRQQTSYDASLPSNGLLIYHIDDGVYGNNSQWYPGHTTSGHYQVALEQADALWQLEQETNSGNAGDPYPGSSNNRNYNASSTPNSKDYNNQLTGIAVQNISNSSASMTADLFGSQPITLTLTAPNGGETKLEGDPDTIRWTSANLTGNIRIDLNRTYPSTNWVTIVTSAANTGSYVRNIPTGLTTTARLRIVSISYPAVGDTSNANFTITRRSIDVTAPNTAVTLSLGDSTDIAWTSQNLAENVSIEINRSYPSATWTAIATNVANNGTYRWLVSGASSSTSRIRIRGATHTSVGDSSNVNFTIASRAVTVTSPNSATTLVAGDVTTIQWTTTNMGTEQLRIELNRNYPSGNWESITNATANDGSHTWTVSEPVTNAARVRITGTVHTSISDVSNTNFSIARRTITVTRPNTNIVFVTGGPDTIRWTSANMSGNVKVELNRSYPSATWEILTASTSNTGWYRWSSVSGAVTNAARVRVSAVSFPAVIDTSDNDFSIATGSVTLLAPNGGEVKIEGEPDTIRWTSTNITDNMRIDLNRTYPSTNWVTIVTSAPNTGWYVRNIPSGTTTTARLRIVAINHENVCDTSNANFSVVSRSISVTAPNTATTWVLGDSADITWTSQNLTENVSIELNRTYPSASWVTLASNVVNSGSSRCLVTGPTGGSNRIRVRGVTHTSVGDTSNVNFTIGSRAITVTAPNTAASLIVGDATNIQWTTSCLGAEPVKIELNRNYPNGTWDTIAASTPNDGSHSWTVTEPLTSTARVRITGTIHPDVSDVSNANFSIVQRSMIVSRPNTALTFVSGGPDTIRWTSANMSGNVKIELNRGYPTGQWEVLTASTTNSGWYRWNYVSTPTTSTARIRVTAVSYPTIGDTSDVDFSIVTGSLTLLAPNGGEVTLEGDADTIRWSSANVTGNLRIDLNRTYPSTNWVTIVTSAPNTGSYVRNIPTGATTTARLRIVAINFPSVADTSDANFTVAPRSITVTAPNTATTWIVGDSADITWTSQNVTENVQIEINRSYPSATWTVLAPSVANSGAYRWQVTSPNGASTRIRVRGTVHTAAGDTSNASFTIGSRAITVTAPNSATTLVAGDATNIQWTTANVGAEQLRIEVNRNYPAGTWETIIDGTPNDGTHSWAVTEPLTSAARVRISGAVHTSVSDVSNANFSIARRSLTVTRPNGGQVWVIGIADTIRWTSTFPGGNVTIALNRAYPNGNWDSLATTTMSSGWYRWTPSGALTEAARVRVTSVSYAAVGDTSDADFAIRTSGAPPLEGDGLIIGASALTNALPEQYVLLQNFPNPFNASTEIRFGLPAAGFFELVVYDMLGREVAVLLNEDRTAGWHQVSWRGTDERGQNLASGVYLVKLSAPSFVQTRKLVLLK